MGRKRKDTEADKSLDESYYARAEREKQKLLANGYSAGPAVYDEVQKYAAIDVDASSQLMNNYQQKLMESYLKIQSPISNMMTTLPDANQRMHGNIADQQQRAWDVAFTAADPAHLHRGLKKVLDNDDYIVDGGTKIMYVPADLLVSLTHLVNTLVQHGPPRNTRSPLTWRELESLLEKVTRAILGGHGDNMPEQYRRFVRNMPDQKQGEAVMIALSQLGMLP